MRAALKYFLITVLFFICLCWLTVTALLYFPEKVTPYVVGKVNEQINGTLHIGDINITVFKNFPDIKVELSGSSLYHSVGKSQADTVAVFDSLTVSASIWKLMSFPDIEISDFKLVNPRIRLFKNAEGLANWELTKDFSSDTTQVTSQDTTTENISFKLHNLTLLNGELIYEDEQLDDYASIENINTNLNLAYLGDEVFMGIDLSADSVMLSQRHEVLSEKNQIKVRTNAHIDLASFTFDFEDSTQIFINELALIMGGWVKPDTLENFDMDLNVSLSIPSLKRAYELIPKQFISPDYQVDMNGSLTLNAAINGRYGNESVPKINARLLLKEGGLESVLLPSKVGVDFDLDVSIDPSRVTSSSVNINHLLFTSNSVDFSLSGRATDIYGNPKVAVKTNGDVDFYHLFKLIPFDELGMDRSIFKIDGVADFDLETTFFLKDIENNDFGKINAKGLVKARKIQFAYKRDSIIFDARRINVHLGQELNKSSSGGASDLLHGKLRVRDADLKIENRIAYNSGDLLFTFETPPIRDSIQQLSVIESYLRVYNPELTLGDTLKGNSKKLVVRFNYGPSSRNKLVSEIKSIFKLDTVEVVSGESYMKMVMLKSDMATRIKNKEEWPTTGTFKITDMVAFTPLFPHIIQVAGIRLNVRPQILNIVNARVKIAKSKIILNGKIDRLDEVLFEGKKVLKANLDLKSPKLDINQLIRLFNKGVRYQKQKQGEQSVGVASTTQATEADTTGLQTLMIPKGIDFFFRSDIDSVLFGDLKLADVKGAVIIKDQKLDLRNINFDFNSSKVNTWVSYEADNEQNARSKIDMRFQDLDIGHLVEVMPFLDTLLPMAKSFEGLVNFGIKGRFDIKENMEVETSSINAISRVEAENLVLLDGESFRDIAKTLKFKNRERNLVDSAKFEMSITNGDLEIFPSLVSIDRYQIALGGIQKLDMSYSYHISVLKSPLPFKTGIDIFGKAPDYDFKITKAKYKYIFSDKEKHDDKVDEEMQMRRKMIMDRIDFDHNE